MAYGQGQDEICGAQMYLPGAGTGRVGILPTFTCITFGPAKWKPGSLWGRPLSMGRTTSFNEERGALTQEWTGRTGQDVNWSSHDRSQYGSSNTKATERIPTLSDPASPILKRILGSPLLAHPH